MKASHTPSSANQDIEALVRTRFEPVILAEAKRLVEIGEAARFAAIHEALAELAKGSPKSGVTQVADRGPSSAKAKAHTARSPHPVATYWSRFTAEERSTILRERRSKGLLKKRQRDDAEAMATPQRPAAVRGARRVVDLFCRAGGSTVGWKEAGFDVVLGVDNSEAALATYRANHAHDVRKLDLSHVGHAAAIIESYRPDIIIGSPPCTDFSSAGRRREGAAADLTRSFAEIVAKVRPRLFVFENVPQARRSRAYVEARAILEKSGYGFSEAVLDACRCGVPQRRRRLFLVGMLGEQAGWLDLSRGIASMPLSLREAFGEAFPQHHYRHPRNSQRRAVFSADEPSPTIRGTNRPMSIRYQPRYGDTMTPNGARALTTRERAGIQTFPASYRWHGSKTAIELQIGNAVPPKMAKFVGDQLLTALQEVASAIIIRHPPATSLAA